MVTVKVLVLAAGLLVTTVLSVSVPNPKVNSGNAPIVGTVANRVDNHRVFTGCGPSLEALGVVLSRSIPHIDSCPRINVKTVLPQQLP